MNSNITIDRGGLLPPDEVYIASLLALDREIVKVNDNPFEIPGYPEFDSEGKTLEQRKEERFIDYLMKRGIYYDDSVVLPEIGKEELLAKIKGISRQWKVGLRNLLKLVKSEMFSEYTDHTLVIFFSQHSKRLLSIFKSGANIWHATQLAQKVGLIVCVDENFCYNSEVSNFCRRYAWNKKVADHIRSLCGRYRIQFNLPKSPLMKRALKNRGKLLKKAKDKVGVLDKVRISQRTALPMELTDDEVTDALMENYPQLKWAMETSARLNEILPDDEQIKALPNIVRAKTRISKISFRISNPLINLKEHENDHKDYSGRWRKDVLRKKFQRWISFDVSSSIYKVTYAINKGVWLSQEVDLYREMSGIDFPTKEDRENYKHGAAMKLYFEPGTNSIINHLSCKGLDKSYLKGVNPTIEEARQRMHKILGGSLYSEIFLHESCIYLEAYRRMVEEKGWRVIQIFDGFYIKQEPWMNEYQIKEEIAKIIEESALWYIKKYLNRK